MRASVNLIDHASGVGPHLAVDFDELRLTFFVGDPAVDLDRSFESMQSMDASYRAHVASWLRAHACYDVDNLRDFEPPYDLVAWRTELEACASGPAPTGATALDRAVLELAALLRRKLNEGLGAAPVRVHDVVFSLGDAGLFGFWVNPPLLAGLGDEALPALFRAHRRGGWMGKDFRKAGYSLENNPLDSAFEAFGDPRNLHDAAVSAALYLACAHLEATPALRANVEVAARLRVFFVFHDGEANISMQERALAAAHVDGPAERYFLAQ